MIGKSLTLGIVIGGAVAASFHKALKTTEGETLKLGAALNKTKGQKNSITQFKALEKQLGKTASHIKAAQLETASLGRAIAATDKPTKKMMVDFNRARKRSDDLKQAHRQQKRTLSDLRSEMRAAGIDTRKLGDEETRLGRSIEKTNRALSRQDRKAKAKGRLGALKGRALGAVGSAYSVGRLVAHNAEFEHALTMLSNTGGLSKEQTAKIRAQIRAESLRVNQDKGSLLGGVDLLVGKGLKTGAAVSAIGAIGMAATASGASVLELSNLSFAAMQNMKLSESQLAQGLDILASAGKQGGFELRAMAQFFPTVTAQAQVLGLKGAEGIATLGAALQIARNGAGTDSEAANNLQNFLAKITSKETVTNLQKMGVSVRDVFDQAKANGKNPLIAIIKTIKEVTGGDSFALNKIFGDIQVKNFLNPMLANIDDFNKIYSKALHAQGVNQRDFAKNMQDTTEKTTHLKIAAINLGDAFSRSLKPAVDFTVGKLAGAAEWASDMVTKYPAVGQVIGGLAIGFTALTTAIGLTIAAQWALNTSVVAGSVSMLGRWTGGLMTLGSRVLPLVATGLRAVGVAMAASPIGATIAGIALAAGLIYQYWTPITGFFKSLWSGIKSIFSSVSTWIGKTITHPIDTLKNTLGSTWDSLFGASKPIITKAVPAALAATMAVASPAFAQPKPLIQPVTQRLAQAQAAQPKPLIQPVTQSPTPALLQNIRAASAAPASKSTVVHQDNRASYVVHVNVDGGDPQAVKAAVSDAMAEKEREHAARTRGALFDYQGG